LKDVTQIPGLFSGIPVLGTGVGERGVNKLDGNSSGLEEFEVHD
jgi:hypothetical protein